MRRTPLFGLVGSLTLLLMLGLLLNAGDVAAQAPPRPTLPPTATPTSESVPGGSVTAQPAPEVPDDSTPGVPVDGTVLPDVPARGTPLPDSAPAATAQPAAPPATAQPAAPTATQQPEAPTAAPAPVEATPLASPSAPSEPGDAAAGPAIGGINESVSAAPQGMPETDSPISKVWFWFFVPVALIWIGITLRRWSWVPKTK